MMADNFPIHHVSARKTANLTIQHNGMSLNLDAIHITMQQPLGHANFHICNYFTLTGIKLRSCCVSNSMILTFHHASFCRPSLFKYEFASLRKFRDRSCLGIHCATYLMIPGVRNSNQSVGRF